MGTAPAFLIVDDDLQFSASATDFAASKGFRTVACPTLAEARSRLQESVFDLILLDLRLLDGCGLELMDDMDTSIQGRVVVATAEPSVDSAVQAFRLPVSDYLIKPVPPDRLAELLNEAAARAQARLSESGGHAGMLGISPPMLQVQSQIARVAPTDTAVLVTGESGTGKELAARAIHERSGREGRFVAVNCGAIPGELLASELFGHERGSFTGATGTHRGFIEQAHGGTLFLDEITEMSPQLQVYLLRVLETRTVTRVGSTEERPVDVRIVAATNRPPRQAVADGHLREDLYYRLAEYVLQMPPLRARGEDIVFLAQAFLDRLNLRYGTARRFAPGSEAELMRYGWPGNVRELKSVVQSSYHLSSGDVVKPSFPERRAAPVTEGQDHVAFVVGMTYAEVQRRMLMKTLAYYDNNKSRAARALGVTVRTIYNQLEQLREEEQQAASHAVLQRDHAVHEVRSRHDAA